MLYAQGLPTLPARSRSAVAAQPARMGSGRTSGVLRERRGGSTGSVSHSRGIRGGEARATAIRSTPDDEVIVYAYCTGVFSSRRIQKRLQEDIPFKVLAAGNEPDFRTISDFRKIHIGTLQGLFEQVLEMALEVGAVKVGRVALDGTKVKANASKHKAMSYGRMKEKQKQL